MLLRAFLCWLLALSLAMGSAGLALARHAPQMAGFIALCTTTGETQLAVDAEGNPVAPHHICPDCTLCALAPRPGEAPVWRALESAFVPVLPLSSAHLPARVRGHPPRGPPAKV